MNEFLTTLLQAVLVAAVPVCAAFMSQGLKSLASYLGQKSENDMAKKYLAVLFHIVYPFWPAIFSTGRPFLGGRAGAHFGYQAVLRERRVRRFAF